MLNKERIRKKIFHHIFFIIVTIFCWLVLSGYELNAREYIDSRSGRLFLTTTDLLLKAGAINLKIKRTLKNKGNESGLLGTRWRMNWESRLFREKAFVIIEENGIRLKYNLEQNGDSYKNIFGECVVFNKNGVGIRNKQDTTQEIFDAKGRLVERGFRNGNRIFLRYDEKDRLTRVEGPKGNFLKFTTDNEGRVTRVKASTGATVQYTYTKNDMSLVQVNVAPSILYVYDDSGALTLIDDPQWGVVQFTYDSEGRVLSRRWADGAQERYEYDDEKNIRRHINPDGGITTSRWSGDYRRREITDPMGNKTAIKYDHAGNLVKITGPKGSVAEMKYDDFSRMVSVKDPQGLVTRFEYLGQSSLISSIIRPDCAKQVMEYDDKGNLRHVRRETTTVATFTYYPDGLMESMRGMGTQETKLAYYPNGRLKSMKNTLGEMTQFEYDVRGNLVRQINPLGGETLRRYDDQDRLIEETDSVGRTIRYYYDSLGRLVRFIDPVGGVTRYEYDSRGRLLTETDPLERATRYEYDRAGRLSGTVDSEGRMERFRYDLNGNLTEWIDGLERVTRYQYDSLDRLIAEKQPGGLEIQYHYDSLGNLVGIEEPAGSKSEYRRSGCGFLTARIDPLGAITRYQYDSLGNLIDVIDSNGQTKRFSYTPNGLFSSVTEPTGDEVRYAYDASGRLERILRPGGGVMRFEYDAMGNITAEIDPMGNQRLYQYDPEGRLVRRTDPMGGITEFNYDKMDRIQGKRLPDGKRIEYKYTPGGDLIRIDDKTFPIHYSYDSNGRLTRKEYSSIRKSIAYEYDRFGLQTKLIDPETREIHYEYNDLKQLTAIVLPDGKRIAFVYDIKDRLKTTYFPNGIRGLREYDMEDRITVIRYKARNGETIFGWTYQYDESGELIEQRDHKGRATRFQYDSAGQVTEERGPGYTISYEYALGGNRIRSEENGAVTTYKYDVADRLIQRGREHLSYDKNSRLIARTLGGKTTRYEYDAGDRLVKVVTPDGRITSYGYTPTGQRVWKKDRGGLTYYLYDGLDLIQEVGKTGRTNVTYIHSLGLDKPLAMIRENRIYYYHADQLGSIRYMTDDRGKIVARYDYDAFGNHLTHRASVSNPFTFTAREFDSATGLYYYRARYYDAGLGRFLTTDPISARLDQPLEQNPYIYVLNNPLRFTDPLGLRNVIDIYDELIQLRSQLGERLARNEGFLSSTKDMQKQIVKLMEEINRRGYEVRDFDDVFTSLHKKKGGRLVKRSYSPGEHPSSYTKTQKIPRPETPSGKIRISGMSGGRATLQGWRPPIEGRTPKITRGDPTGATPYILLPAFVALSAGNILMADPQYRAYVAAIEASAWLGSFGGIALATALSSNPLGWWTAALAGVAGSWIGSEFVSAAISGVSEMQYILSFSGQSGKSPYLSPQERLTGPYASLPATGAIDETPSLLYEPSGTSQKPVNVGPPPLESGKASSSASSKGTKASSGTSKRKQLESQLAGEFNWNKLFPKEAYAYLYHVTKTHTYSGSFDRDMYMIHKAEKPDANGQIHDSQGHYEVSGPPIGPLTTPKAICEAYSGIDPTKGRAPGGWAGVTFNCDAYLPKSPPTDPGVSNRKTTGSGRTY